MECCFDECVEVGGEFELVEVGIGVCFGVEVDFVVLDCEELLEICEFE